MVFCLRTIGGLNLLCAIPKLFSVTLVSGVEFTFVSKSMIRLLKLGIKRLCTSLLYINLKKQGCLNLKKN